MTSVLLHDTVKDLHGLLQAVYVSSEQFDLLLRRILHNLSELLELSNHAEELDITTSIYNPLLLVFYTNNTPVSLADLNNDNIYLYLKDDVSVQSGESLFNQLLHLLAESHKDRRPVRLKQSYLDVVSRLSELVQFFVKLHRDAESQLTDLLLRCFAYEHSYFGKLRSQLDHPSNDDTQNMVLALDSFIRRMPDEASDTDSLFSYGHDESDKSLDFECLDDSLLKLYRTFLQLALQKSLDSFFQDASAYVKVMVKLFKVSSGIDFFEENSANLAEIKKARICDFFLGSEFPHDKGLVPPQFQARARSTIENLFNVQLHLEDAPESSFVQNYPHRLDQDEIVELLSNLNVVVSTLKEYGLQFDLSFPATFQTYIHLVYEVFEDLAEPEDFEYIDNIDYTVGEIVNFESPQGSEKDIIRDIVSQLFDMHSRLLFSVDGLTLLMRAARRDVEYRNRLMGRMFRKWNHKVLVVAQLDLIYEDQYSTKRQATLLKKNLSIWYNKTVRYGKVWQHAASYSDKKLMSGILSSFWLRKIIDVSTAKHQADIHSMKPFFELWRKKQLSIVQKVEGILAVTLSRTQMQAFDIWVTKFRLLQLLDTAAKSFNAEHTAERDHKVVRHAFGVLRSRLQELYKLDVNFSPDQLLPDKLEKLERLEVQLCVGKCLKLWNKRYELAKSYKETVTIRNRDCKRRVFSAWKKLCELKAIGRFQEGRSEQLLLKSLFHHWKFVLDSRLQADSFSASAVLQRAIRKWKLRLVEVDFNDKIERRILADGFQKWKLAMLLENHTQVKNTQLLTRVSQTWNERSKVVAKNFDVARDVYNANLSAKVFQLWRAKYNLWLELAAISDLNFQRKYLNKMLGLYVVSMEREEKADEYLESKVPFEKRLLLQSVMKNWNQKYLEKFDDHSLKSIEMFHDRVTIPGTLRVFLRHWRNRKVRNERKVKQLEINHLHFTEVCASKRAFFDHWKTSYRSKLEDHEKSEQFHMNLLRKKFLLIWYEKHVTKVEYLNDVAQHMIDQKDYLKLVDHLRRWNLKYIKNVKRNQQTCDMFAEKWEKAHLRSMLEIWIHKARSRSSPGYYVDANSTIGSNYSPLARKNAKLPTGSSLLDGQSYLTTPVKKQVSPSTPFSNKGPSPTRLQETNQRMKVDRMDALISRYRLAKKDVSKSSILRTSASTKLSPPRSKIPIPVKPPAPMFGLGSSVGSSPNATSSPSVTPKPIETTPSSVSESSILATAKKLRRIKPLVVPPEDQEVHFSANKLRLNRDSQLSKDIFSV